MSHPVWPCTPEFPLRAESGLGQATSRLAEFSAKRGFRRRHCAGPARSDCFLVRQAVRQKGREEQGQESHRGHSVRVVLSHRIAIVPTAPQEVLLRQAVGVARFAYNWALAEWKRQYAGGEKPSEAALRRQLNSIKHQQFPWMRLVPKSVPQQAIKNCGAAFERFFKKQGRAERSYPARNRFRPIWKDCRDFPGGTAGRRKAATTGANRPCGWPACTHASRMSGKTGCTRQPPGWCASFR